MHQLLDRILIVDTNLHLNAHSLGAFFYAGMYKMFLIQCIIFPMKYFDHPSKKHNCILYAS